MDFFITIIIGIFGVILGLFVLKFLLVTFSEYKYQQKIKNEKGVLLRLLIEKENEKGPIMMEQVFASLHGIYHHLSWWNKLFGVRQDRISFEIANIGNKIYFYIWTPRKYKNLVEGQMYAQYPEIEISEIEDYIIFDKNKNKGFVGYDIRNPIESDIQKDQDVELISGEGIQYGVTAEMGLTEVYMYPIKRYPQFEDKLARVAADPLAGITAAMTKIDSKEQIWMQIVISPISDYWRKRGIKALRVLKKLSTKWIFKNSFWLTTQVQKLYAIQSYWTRFWLSPLYFFLWGYRGGGVGNIIDTQTMTQSRGRDEDEELKEEFGRNHDRETTETASLNKISQLGFNVNIRFVYIPKNVNLPVAEVKLNELASSFKQFNLPQMNGFTIRTINKHNHQILKRFKFRSIIKSCKLNIEELSTIYHLPNILVQTPNIQWITSKKLEPPGDLPEPEHILPEKFTLIGAANFRGSSRKFGIKTVDRRRHIYVIGKTGMGKSTLLENMVFSDIQNGKGVAVIDPHGDLADAVIDFVPKRRTNDVLIFDPSDVNYPVSFNMLECENKEHRTLVSSGLLGVFKKLYADSWGPRLEHILRNTILALIEFPNTSMLGITRMLVDKSFRKKVVGKVTDPLVRSFWIDEFEKMQDRQRLEAISPIQNKVGQFLSSSVIRNIVGQVKSSIDIRFCMDRKKIVVVNLSKGKIGEDNSALLGSMLITKFQLDAMSRADISESERVDFYLYVDEFQNFATESFATILSEARKYKLSITMANQYIAQMPEEVQGAVFGNVGTIISFQVGYEDAEYLSGQYAEDVTPNDIVSLPKYNIYTRLMIDGMPSKTFSASTLPPPEFNINKKRKEKIIKVSREKYAANKEMVEDKINRWSGSAPERKDEKKNTKSHEQKSDKKKPDKKESGRKEEKTDHQKKQTKKP